jgi:hypothetical protein
MIQKLLKKIESTILTKLFKRWVADEWDLELLHMTAAIIHNREAEVKEFVNFEPRMEISGFKNKI